MSGLTRGGETNNVHTYRNDILLLATKCWEITARGHVGIDNTLKAYNNIWTENLYN